MRRLIAAVVASSVFAQTAASGGSVFDYYPTSHWTGICESGTRQSPINIDADHVHHLNASVGGFDLVTLGTLDEYTVFFTGTSLEVEFGSFSIPMSLRIPANAYTIGPNDTIQEGDMLELEPVQMHLHTLSEHTVNGMYAPGELHIVTKVKAGQSQRCDTTGGCIAVFGVMMEFKGEGHECNHVLKGLFSVMPTGVGLENGVFYHSALNLDHLLPASRDYYTYLGSLTTPPCTESVTWHLFSEHGHISEEVVQQHQLLVAITPGDDCTISYSGACFPPREKTNDRAIQPHHGRGVYLVHV